MVYGGDPQIIATRDELFRCANVIRGAISELNSAIWAQSPMVLDFLPNPIPNIQLAVMAPSLISRLETLVASLYLAAEGYFSTEAQINAQLSQVFEPLSLFSPIAAMPSPFAPIAARELLGIGAALAVVGLTGKPSSGKAALVGQALQIAPLAFGKSSPSQLLASKQATALGLGLSVDASASVSKSFLGSVSPARSLEEHAKRLNTAYFNPPSSIRIEVYKSKVGRDLVVYVPGTQSFEMGGKNPLNIRSNLTALGNIAKAPSQKGVELALEQLGAAKGDRVLFVGHSQGALIAGNISAAEQDYEVAGLISLGGPIAHLNLDVPVLALENSQDPVPHLSGERNPLTENWVTAEATGIHESLVEAHGMEAYQETAMKADLSEDPGLERIKGMLLTHQVSRGQEYLFEIERN